MAKTLSTQSSRALGNPWSFPSSLSIPDPCIVNFKQASKQAGLQPSSTYKKARSTLVVGIKGKESCSLLSPPLAHALYSKGASATLLLSPGALAVFAEV